MLCVMRSGWVEIEEKNIVVAQYNADRTIYDTTQTRKKDTLIIIDKYVYISYLPLISSVVKLVWLNYGLEVLYVRFRLFTCISVHV